jgi:flagellar protein FliS
MLTNPYAQYRCTQAQTARPADLVVMLYQGAIRFANQAILALEEGRLEAAHVALLRAQDVLAELERVLDPSAGPIAENLAALYLWARQRLIQANVRKDPRPAGEVVRVLRELLPAWEQAAQRAPAQRVPVEV